MPEKRTAAEVRRASVALQRIFQKLPFDVAYAIVSTHLHSVFDQLPASTVDRLLVHFVADALESREAGAQGRPANFSVAHLFTRWADVQREGTSIHVSVSLSATLTGDEWDQAQVASVADIPAACEHHQP